MRGLQPNPATSEIMVSPSLASAATAELRSGTSRAGFGHARPGFAGQRQASRAARGCSGHSVRRVLAAPLAGGALGGRTRRCGPLSPRSHSRPTAGRAPEVRRRGARRPIRAYFPRWDTQVRPGLCGWTRRCPSGISDFKPRPELLDGTRAGRAHRRGRTLLGPLRAGGRFRGGLGRARHRPRAGPGSPWRRRTARACAASSGGTSDAGWPTARNRPGERGRVRGEGRRRYTAHGILDRVHEHDPPSRPARRLSEVAGDRAAIDVVRSAIDGAPTVDPPGARNY